MPNKDLGVPNNNFMKYNPIRSDKGPIYWMDGQIFDETTQEYTPNTMKPFYPMKIPKVIRFLYGYKKTDVPTEEDVRFCGCPSGTCPGNECSWVLTATNIFFAVTAIPDLEVPWSYSDGSFIVNSASLDGGPPSLFGTLAHVETVNITIYDPAATFNVVYSGPIIDAPAEYLKQWWCYQFVWNKSCTGTPPEDCLNSVTIMFVTTIRNDSPQCSHVDYRVTAIATAVGGLGRFVSSARTTETLRDYPPYNYGCVPGPGPCGD